jgi:ATP-dependent Lhr-like helicase
MLQAQARLSQLPRRGRLLVEQLPLARRAPPVPLPLCRPQRAHRPGAAAGLAAGAHAAQHLFAERQRLRAGDRGRRGRWTLDGALDRRLFGTRDLLADVLASLNSGELAQRRFREIARVAGLVFTGYPGAPKSMRQLQASSACSTRSSASTTPATACWRRPSRGAGAGAGPAAPGPRCSTWPRWHGPRRAAPRPARLRCR